MANGDKPPGGVFVAVKTPTFEKEFTITCHSEDDADTLAKKIADFVAEEQEEYGKH